MKRASLLALLLCATAALAGVYPDFGYQPPSDWAPRPTFVLSQNFPKTQPAKPTLPWESIDPAKQPEQYMAAVIAYCYEGNIAADFEPAKNTTRAWFHAPWLHYGKNGREFVNGLTGERSSRPYELAATQSGTYRNFAVGFYNDLGAYTIGKVWANPQSPDSRNVSFPEGTVSFKLLFTTAPASAAAFLAGSPEWVADIDRSPTAAQVLANKVRLLQIDIAIKDRRSLNGGWILGTFHYDAAIPGPTPWHKLRPLTLMWGDDPTLTPTQYAAGKRPTESWVNAASPIAQFRANAPASLNAPRMFGLAGRGNGPVDNPVSSCMSCHSTAQINAASEMLPPKNLTETQALRWFRNLAPNEAFDAGQNTLDFSLQLGVGIQNFIAANPPPPAPPAPMARSAAPASAQQTASTEQVDGLRVQRAPDQAGAAAPEVRPQRQTHIFSRDQ